MKIRELLQKSSIFTILVHRMEVMSGVMETANTDCIDVVDNLAYEATPVKSNSNNLPLSQNKMNKNGIFTTASQPAAAEHQSQQEQVL